MADRTPAELARMARQHIESLRAAGVEWIPAATQSGSAPSLFGEELDPVTTAGQQPGQASVSAAASLSPEQKKHEFQVLAECVSKCTRCAGLAATRTQTVFGVGNPNAELCFIGEAPGADEDAKGEPFVGAAGQLLNKIISACGMKREEVYICNILKCRPPGNRLPNPDEAANCREYLEKQLELLRPKFICALGACAAQNLLNTTASVGKLRGRFLDYRGIPVLCTYHPAYLLRNPVMKKEVWEDMKKLMQRMGRPVKQ
jgi:uracil-DNA glycosylase family 4